MKRTGIDCFAGIGGFSLAMRNCGIEPKVQIEIDEFCQIILKKNFPKAKRFRDICGVSDANLRRLRKPWIVCGGFPCQDISTAGRGAGLVDGERSGLWREMWRVIRNTRPDWLLIENVPALRTRGADSVLVALEALGYTAWSLVVGAIHVGAPHQRQRVWIVAHAEGDLRGTSWNHGLESLARSGALEYAKGVGTRQGTRRTQSAKRIASESNPLGNSSGKRKRKSTNKTNAVADGREARDEPTCSNVSDTDSDGIWQQSRRCSGAHRRQAFVAPRGCEQYEWEEPRTVERGLGRTIDGLSGRLDKHRIKALGNAIVPQVAEAILRAIIAVEEQLID